jgi:hypothetical protein
VLYGEAISATVEEDPMKARTKAIDVRELESRGREEIAAMRRELSGRSGQRWRARFVASGKQASGKITR